MKEFDVRVQSLIYQITTLSKLEAEKAEKSSCMIIWLRSCRQLTRRTNSAGAHAGRNGTHCKGFRTKKEQKAGLNIAGSLLGTIPRGRALWGNSLLRHLRKTDRKDRFPKWDKCDIGTVAKDPGTVRKAEQKKSKILHKKRTKSRIKKASATNTPAQPIRLLYH